MKIYNSATHQKEDFRPIEEGKVRMYVCGPTVYDNIHIGNARTFISFDVIRRWLIASGYEVTFAQNLTDVDDKIINRANEQGRTAEEVATEFSDNFIGVMRAANVLDPDVRPRATKEIGAMIGMIKTLIEGGHAYAADNGDVYFSVRSDPSYGEVSGRNIDDLMVGARIEENEDKRDPLDFALWKAAKPGEPSWKSPWGEGRPGWHTECAAMVHRYLGTPIDIHGGGSDLAFPHHENECAQATCAWHEGFANTWMHTGMLLVDGEKMSKSLGNCIYLSDEPEDIKKKIMSMYTDPNHLRVQDPGKVEGNPVFIYLDAFSRPEHFAEFLPEYQNLDELKAHYQRGGLGDVKVKKFLNSVMQAELEPIRNRRKEWEQRLPEVVEILKEGSAVAEKTAAATLAEVRKSMKIDYFTDDNLLK